MLMLKPIDGLHHETFDVALGTAIDFDLFKARRTSDILDLLRECPRYIDGYHLVAA